MRKKVGRQSSIKYVAFLLLMNTQSEAQAQDYDCNLLRSCFATTSASAALADSLRKRGENVQWDEVKALEKFERYSRTLLRLTCQTSDDEIEGLYQREIDKISQYSQSTGFVSILDDYVEETVMCNQRIGFFD